MVLRLGPQILEDALRPKALHVIPILDHTMLDRIMQAVRLGICNRLVADVEIEIIDAALGREVARFTRDRGCAGGPRAGGARHGGFPARSG